MGTLAPFIHPMVHTGKGHGMAVAPCGMHNGALLPCSLLPDGPLMSPGSAAPLGRSHADAGDGDGAGAGAAAAPARQPCGRRASIDAFTVARDGTPLPRAALGAKVEPV